MNHSDCDGDYSPEEAESLLKELEQIRNGFTGVNYPAVIYYDQEGKPIGESYKYSEDGICCGGGGYEFGVDEKGIVVEYFSRISCIPDSNCFSPLKKDSFGEMIYQAHFDRLERLEKGTDNWRCYAGDKSIILKELYTGAPPECVRIKFASVPVLKVFKSVVNALEALCKASIATGNRIIFC